MSRKESICRNAPARRRLHACDCRAVEHCTLSPYSVAPPNFERVPYAEGHSCPQNAGKSFFSALSRSKNPRTSLLYRIPSCLLRPTNPSTSNVVFSSPCQSSISIGLFHESIIDLQQTLRYSDSHLKLQQKPPPSIN